MTNRQKAQQFLDQIIRPVLGEMDMWSKSAEKLMLMTACHESGGFQWQRQLNGGPALSWYQIEPRTAKDLYNSYLAYRPTMRDKLRAYEPENGTIEDALMDGRYATALARLIYYRIPAPIGAATDENLAYYWKTYWNTALGKGTKKGFIEDWHRYKPEGYL